VSVQVGVSVIRRSTTTGRRAWRSAVAVVDIATRGRVVIDGRAPTTRWRRSVTVVTRVVVVPGRRRATTVVVTARAVAARRAATVIVVVHRRTTVSTVTTIATAAVAWRARTETGLALTRDLGLRLLVVNGESLHCLVKRRTYVGNALDRDTLKVVSVQLLDSGLEVGGSLVLDETLATRAGGIALAVDLTIDNVKARLASEVLEILRLRLADAGIVLQDMIAFMRQNTYLPAGLEWKAGDGHTVNGATRARSHALLSKARTITRTGAATRELDDQALAHELGAV
jgi:hypothetical protein